MKDHEIRHFKFSASSEVDSLFVVGFIEVLSKHKKLLTFLFNESGRLADTPEKLMEQAQGFCSSEKHLFQYLLVIWSLEEMTIKSWNLKNIVNQDTFNCLVEVVIALRAES